MSQEQDTNYSNSIQVSVTNTVYESGDTLLTIIILFAVVLLYMDKYSNHSKDKRL